MAIPGRSDRVAGYYSEARQAYHMASEGVIPNAVLVLIGMTSCYINLGRLSEARETAAKIMKGNPDFSLERYTATMPFKNQSDLDVFIESLRQAGLPD